MLRLHGFSASNYYNVPKLAFLEKGVAFEEVVSYTGVGPKYKPEYLDKSPLGKVPALETRKVLLANPAQFWNTLSAPTPSTHYCQLALLALPKCRNCPSSLNFILN